MSSNKLILNEKRDNFSYSDAWKILRAGRYIFVAVLIVAFIGSLAFIFFVPQQYEATAVIQPAMVGTSDSGAKGIEIESAGLMIERLKLPTFYSDDLLDACSIKDQSNWRQSLVSTVVPTLVKGNSLVKIVYRSSSPELAKSCLIAIIDRIAKSQAAMMTPVVKLLEDQRSLTERQLIEAEKLVTQVEQKALQLDSSDSKFSQAILTMSLVVSKREEISRLRRLYITQTLQLVEPYTSPTKLFEPIYAPDKAIFPNKILVIFTGLFMGAILGFLILFVRENRKRFFLNLNLPKSKE